MKATLFSLIIPSRHRTEQLRRLLDSLAACTANLDDLEVILVIDSDDDETIQFQYDAARLKRVQVSPGLPMGTLNAAGFREATGAYLMLVNDDVIVRTPGWDRQVLDAFRSFPDGIALVHVNDLFFKETLCIFPFLTREFCLLAGSVCPAGYVRYAIDNHLQDIFELLRRLGHDRSIYLPDVVFEHANVKRTGLDAARYLPNPAIHEVDIRLFESLKEERRSIAQAVLRFIEARQPPSERRVTIAILSEDSKSPSARKCIELIGTCTANHDLILIDRAAGPVRNPAHEMNGLISRCATEYLVLMHDDVFVRPGWLEGMLRSLDPKVGVVTPVHRDRRGELSYAGMAISLDVSGHAPILELPPKPRRIQTLSGAILLIDMAKCGHIRLDEECPNRLSDIDYGLRVWEEGFEVVCTPYAEVTHLGDALLDPLEARQYYLQRWAATGRLEALRQGVWKTIPEIAWIDEKARDIDGLFDRDNPEEFRREGPGLARSVAAYPALKNYIAARARARIGNERIRVDDPQTGHLALLLGLSGQPVLVEAGFEGANIILEDFTYYAVPQVDGARYTRSLRAESLADLKALMLRLRDAPAHGHVLSGPPPDHVPWPALPAGPPSAIKLHSAEASPAGARGSDIVRLSGVVASREKQIARLSGIVHLGSSLDAKRINPLLHFLATGAYQGSKPNPLFDPTYYLAENPEVAAAGMNPLVHFLETGAAHGCWPNPLFNTAYYLRQNPHVTEAGMDPLEHFLELGAAQGLKPNPLFDTAYYLTQYPDVAESGMNPLEHFLELGAVKGYQPNPLFDTAYYLRQNPDLSPAGINPLIHFLASGARQGCCPNPLFDLAYYLQQNPDVAETGINPLEHFLEFGAAQGRKPNPLFDTRYYLEQNPDLLPAGINPLVHFLASGARLGLRPNPLFDTAYYLLQNPDVAKAGINPLAHFLEQDRDRFSASAEAPYVSNDGPKLIPDTRLAPLSVVIPTHNRGKAISETLEACHRNAGGCELEIIVIDDGSTDDTRQRLSTLSSAIPNLTWYSIAKAGFARARNVGADLARHDVILFLSDQTCPLNDDFFRIHAALHSRYTAPNFAALGKVDSGCWRPEPIAYLMAHILGRGATQFGNLHLTPRAFVSWPYFDTANISVKKTLVRDWILDGFETDPPCPAYQGLELACRLSKTPDGLAIFYDPAALASQQPVALAQFMERQFSMGKALAHLVARHPELAMDCNPSDLLGALCEHRCSEDLDLAAEYPRLIDGAKAWARLLDGGHENGSQPGHADFLPAVMELCAQDGFASAWAAGNGAALAARAIVVDRFCRRLRQSRHHDLAEWIFLVNSLVAKV